MSLCLSVFACSLISMYIAATCVSDRQMELHAAYRGLTIMQYSCRRDGRIQMGDVLLQVGDRRVRGPVCELRMPPGRDDMNCIYLNLGSVVWDCQRAREWPCFKKSSVRCTNPLVTLWSGSLPGVLRFGDSIDCPSPSICRLMLLQTDRAS